MVKKDEKWERNLSFLGWSVVGCRKIEICILCVCVIINKRSFEPFCLSILRLRHFVSFVFDVNMCLVLNFCVIFHLWVNAAIHWQYDYVYWVNRNFISGIFLLIAWKISLCQFWDFCFILMRWMIQLLNNYYYSWEKNARFYFLFYLLFTDRCHILYGTEVKFEEKFITFQFKTCGSYVAFLWDCWLSWRTDQYIFCLFL